MNRIPVHIVTGFLGAGKTTFLNHFIAERSDDRILVIENEVGSTNIDGALVMDKVEEVVELTAGCLCCSLSGDLLDILYEVSQRKNDFDRLVIETTGIADPGSIIQVFLENFRVEQFFKLEQVISLADARLLEQWLTETDEALRQIAVADAILINKADTVAEPYLMKVKNLVGETNPTAKIWTGSNGEFPVSEILDSGTTDAKHIEVQLSKDKHDHDHHNNSHGITSFTLSFSHPLDLDSLSLELNRLIHLHNQSLYRIKGIIAIPNYPNRVILQSAQSTFIASDGTPWQDGEGREGKLVFIGKGIRKEDYKELFERYLVEDLPLYG